MLRAGISSRFSFLSLFLILMIVLELVPEEAEARRRRGRGFFGRRVAAAPAPRRVRANRGAVARNRVGAQRRVARNNDIFGLDQEPVNLLTSLNVDPTGNLQRLAFFPNLAVGRNGQFFELNGTNILDPRQPLLLSNGQVIGGSLGGLLPETQAQIQILNTSGNFNTFR